MGNPESNRKFWGHSLARTAIQPMSTHVRSMFDLNISYLILEELKILIERTHGDYDELAI
jgi:hypothetical protein